MMKFTSRFVLASLVAGSASLHAQSGPPLAKAAVRDSAPPLVRLKSPSPPPSSVAPRTRVQPSIAGGDAENAPKPMTPPSPPVESVRPSATPAPAVEPRRSVPPPPRPTATVRAAESAPAALRADVQPADATGRCTDGMWLTGAIAADACAGRGGLAVRFEPKVTPPKRPM
jgi:hypothetical protein